jgi:hypothetical protein
MLLPLVALGQEIRPETESWSRTQFPLFLEPGLNPPPEPVLEDRPRGPLDHSDQANGPWGSLNTHVLVQTSRRAEEPVVGDRWLTEEALKVSVAGPLFLFGKVGAGFDTLTTQQRQVTGRTALGCRLISWAGIEILFNGGPTVTHVEDPFRPEQLARDRAEMLLELQCQYPLAGPLHLEYQGTAVPASNPLDRNRLDHDLRFAVPLGKTGNFRLGAKCHWEDAAPPRPLMDTMEVYLGLGLNR